LRKLVSGSVVLIAGGDVGCKLMAKTSDEDFAMKHLRICLMLLALATAFACESAEAGHVRVFVGVGVPFYYPVAPIPYYYQPVVAVPVAPTNYIEKGYRQPDRASRAAPGITAIRPRPITRT
jgi:hypothetical protein